MFTEYFQVEARSPFNFDLTANIFSGGDKQIRSYENGKFSQVLKINSQLALIQLASAGTVDKPKISVEIKSNNPTTSQDKQNVEEAVKFIFNLDFDLCSFYVEPLLKPCWIQFLSNKFLLKVAQNIEVRLIKEFGETLNLDG